MKWFKSFCGGAGYRSRYLSHAKRALYHLSYAPVVTFAANFNILIQKRRKQILNPHIEGYTYYLIVGEKVSEVQFQGPRSLALNTSMYVIVFWAALICMEGVTRILLFIIELTIIQLWLFCFSLFSFDIIELQFTWAWINLACHNLALA